jgi:hypothetical protein
LCRNDIIDPLVDLSGEELIELYAEWAGATGNFAAVENAMQLCGDDATCSAAVVGGVCWGRG